MLYLELGVFFIASRNRLCDRGQAIDRTHGYQYDDNDARQVFRITHPYVKNTNLGIPCEIDML